MTFKCYSMSSNVVPIKSSYISCYKWFIVTFAVLLTRETVLMLETTLLPTPLVFDLEFEGHAVGIRNLAPET